MRQGFLGDLAVGAGEEKWGFLASIKRTKAEREIPGRELATWRQGEILKSEVGGGPHRCEDRRDEMWKRRMSWERAKEMWRTARDNARSFEQSQGRGIPSSPIRARGIFRMPSQRAIFSFNHSLAWAEGLHQLLPVGLYVFLFTARSCRKGHGVVYRDQNEGTSGKDQEDSS